MKSIIINILITICWLAFMAAFIVFMPIWLGVDVFLWIVSDTKFGAYVKWVWNCRKVLRFR